MAVLDTHALLWWTLDPGKLSRKARTACNKIEEQGGYASSISVWELGIKIRNGKLDIGMSIRDYVEKLKSLGCLEIIPVDEIVWVRSFELDWEHRDPADRAIVATALIRRMPLLTKDDSIRTSKLVECIW